MERLSKARSPAVTKMALVALAIILAGVAIYLGVMVSRSSQPAPQPTAPTTQPGQAAATTSAPRATTTTRAPTFSAEGAAQAFPQILRRRDEAYIRVDPAILREIYEPTCPCLSNDLKDLGDERRGGYHLLQGSPVRVRDVRVPSLDPSTKGAFVTAEVNYGVTRYVDAQGQVRFTEPEKGWQHIEAILHWTGQRWRLASVRVM